jgi:hypothetical protein
MCEGTISYKRGARKLKKNSSIRYCKKSNPNKTIYGYKNCEERKQTLEK